MKHVILISLLSLAFASDVAYSAEEPDEPTSSKKEEAEKFIPVPPPRAEKTQHELRLGDQVLKYTATVGWLILNDKEKDEPIARFGYTAYTLDGVKDSVRRPITFAFNGGPGSASIWLHMGALGPRRVIVNDGAYAPQPPVQLVDNEYSILDATDLVMIDPVGTGFSKPVGKAKGEEFWGVDQDIESVGDFIRRYVTENGRWGSPKYVLGESYGGVRGAGLARHLQSKLGMNLNGLILVSPYFGLVSGNDGMAIDLPHVLYVSTFAVTAWYYDAIPNKPASLEAFTNEVGLRDRGVRAGAPEGLHHLGRGEAGDRRETCALHGHERDVLAAGRPARQARAIPPGTAARPGPHCRPDRLTVLGPFTECAERPWTTTRSFPRSGRRTRRPSVSTCTRS